MRSAKSGHSAENDTTLEGNAISSNPYCWGVFFEPLIKKLLARENGDTAKGPLGSYVHRPCLDCVHKQLQEQCLVQTGLIYGWRKYLF